MGRIKTALIKRLTNELLKEHGDEFKQDYEENKKLVEERLDVSSKKIRNIIAGYVTRRIKHKEEI